MKIEFTIPGVPTAWARARTNGKRHFTPGKQRHAMAVVESLAWEAMKGEAPMDGPLTMSIDAVWQFPTSWSEKKKNALLAQYKTSRPDADNVAKLIADSLNGIVFTDDAQVVNLHVFKCYGPSAMTRVTIQKLG